jgi:hypothetical protein
MNNLLGTGHQGPRRTAPLGLAADGDDILTSDPGDLHALAQAAEIHVELIPV